MTRIAIVARSEGLRAALVTALGADPAFEIVAVSESVGDLAPSVDVVLVARSVSDSSAGAPPGAEGGVALTGREGQILALVADGLGNKQIAARLGISTNTVKTHLELLFEKFGVSSRAEAVAMGVRRGLLLI